MYLQQEILMVFTHCCVGLCGMSREESTAISAQRDLFADVCLIALAIRL